MQALSPYQVWLAESLIMHMAYTGCSMHACRLLQLRMQAGWKIWATHIACNQTLDVFMRQGVPIYIVPGHDAADGAEVLLQAAHVLPQYRIHHWLEVFQSERYEDSMHSATASLRDEVSMLSKWGASASCIQQVVVTSRAHL